LKHKLWVLNGVLVGVIAYAGVQFRDQWRSTHDREKAVLSVKVKPGPPPLFSALPVLPPVTASSYAQVAMRTLFDPSRNPNVVVETPPPPPPPVMPALPLCYGVMNLGDGAGAILAENDKSAHQLLHPGAAIGQFKLVDVNTDEIVLEWHGQQIHKALNEIAAAQAAAPPAQAQAQAQVDNTPAPAPEPVKAGPGDDTGRGFKTCSMNDGMAEGAQSEGYRKVVYHTPFGPACRWEPGQ
jgi:hypothetical protein